MIKKMKYLVIAVIFLVLIGGYYVYKSVPSGAEQINIIKVEPDEEISNYKNEKTEEGDFVHISIDDVIGAFEDITINQNKYDSVFDNDFFKSLKMYHEEYGAVFSLYVLYESEEFKLSSTTEKFKDEFASNSDWLKFGFHALNMDADYNENRKDELVNDYMLVTNELLRITGSKKSFDSILRLHFYSGVEEQLKELALEEETFEGLLTADDKRVSYYLDEELTSYVYLHDYYRDDEMEFFKTDVRLENEENTERIAGFFEEDEAIIIAFTHEAEFNNNEIVKRNLKYLLGEAESNSYKFDFPMNR